MSLKSNADAQLYGFKYNHNKQRSTVSFILLDKDRYNILMHFAFAWMFQIS